MTATLRHRWTPVPGGPAHLSMGNPGTVPKKSESGNTSWDNSQHHTQKTFTLLDFQQERQIARPSEATAHAVGAHGKEHERRHRANPRAGPGPSTPPRRLRCSNKNAWSVLSAVGLELVCELLPSLKKNRIKTTEASWGSSSAGVVVKRLKGNSMRGQVGGSSPRLPHGCHGAPWVLCSPRSAIASRGFWESCPDSTEPQSRAAGEAGVSSCRREEVRCSSFLATHPAP